jgi:hypothetical protein
MPIEKDMHEYSIDEVKKWCKLKGLVPGRVKGTKSGVYITKGDAERIEVIDWPEFESILREKNLVVYGTKEGLMKIFKRRTD